MGTLFDFCENDESIQGRSYRPASHDTELLLRRVPFCDLHVSRFDDLPFSDVVDVFLLIVEYDDLISDLQIPQECEYVIVITLDPRVIRGMSEDERNPILAWLCGSWIADNSFLQLLHE